MQNAEEDDARQGKALADRLQHAAGRNWNEPQMGVRLYATMRQATLMKMKSDRGHQPRVRPAQHQSRERTEDELRNRDPDQRLPHFQCAIAAHRAEIQRDQIGRRENRQPQERDQQRTDSASARRTAPSD